MNEPGYIFAQITEKIEQGQERFQQRARHRQRSNLRKQVAAEKEWTAQRRQQQAGNVLNQIPLGGSHATSAQQDLFPAPNEQPSATSTPLHKAEEEGLSFHASDFLFPPGDDQDITFVSIDEVTNATDIADGRTPSGRHMYRQGTTEVQLLALTDLCVWFQWFNVTDLTLPQRGQVGAYITTLINTNRRARGRELLLNNVQPISFNTKQPPQAPHKPPVRSALQTNFNLYSQSPTHAFQLFT